MRWALSAVVVALMMTPAAQAQLDLLGSKERFFTPRLGDEVPGNLEFVDETGNAVRLGNYGRGKPVVLVLAFFTCRLQCPLMLEDLGKGLSGVTFEAGREYDVVVVSFDPRDNPAQAKAKKAHYDEQYPLARVGQGWHFLTGLQPDINRLMDAVGFRAVWDEKQQQYAHARGLMVLARSPRSGELQISRYFLEGAYPPRDLRLALVEASEGKVGGPMDRILLMCFNYNPETGSYSLAILRAVQVGGAVTMAALGLFWWVAWRRRGSSAWGGPVPSGVTTGPGGAVPESSSEEGLRR